MTALEIEVVLDDIVTVRADAVVTAANRSLLGGSGVNGAVHAAAGPELLRASRALAPCPAGSAVVTPAFRMTTATWIVHAVGPKYRGPQDEPVLAAAYAAALARADEVGARTVAFPSIATGKYGYPDAEAAPISVTALRQASTSVQHVLLVARHRHTAALWQAELDRTAP